MTDVRLALGGSMGRLKPALCNQSLVTNKPSILVAYPYYKSLWLPLIGESFVRDMMLDSGAYSVWKSGKEIRLEDYCAFCLDLMVNEPRLVEIVGLDIIGSGEGSLLAATRMWEEFKVPAMPVFHMGEPWSILDEYCRRWSKVGLSCSFSREKTKKRQFYEQCFARHWPHKFHSFGWTDRAILLDFPFHSADSTTWEMVPTAFGQWSKFGKLSVRGSTQKLINEILIYMDMESMLKAKWGREMRNLDRTDKRFEINVQFRRER